MSSSPESVASNRPKVHKAIGPRLRILFHVVLVLVALLVANSAYMAGVSLLDWWAGATGTYQSTFSLWMFLAHIVLGVMLVGPFVVFGLIHMRNTWNRKNRHVVRVGFALFGVSVVVLVTGLLLVRVFVDLKHPAARSAVYWMHVVSPFVAAWLYWLHRLVGPRMRWRSGLVYAGVTVVLAIGMTMLHGLDPRRWGEVGPAEGARYFEPSLARTATGNFIPAESLVQDAYCLKCHPSVHERWSDSVHRFSSFNNPAYLASVLETREVVLERDGSVKASRWCAGCHDPVPFFSGRFDDPKFDVLDDPTASAGITCTVCHAITHVNSNRGNADYTIEEPALYPFTGSENPLLQWVNEQLVKAKPSLHKQTYLKPLHRTSEFCSTCHKVHLPRELTGYKDFLRGQNHYDSFLLSGVSGHGARSFYYPPTAQSDCNGCHMPARDADDFGARPLDGSGRLQVHDHLFPSANTGIAWLRGRETIVDEHRRFLDGTMRVDLFGVREEGTIGGELHAPLRPEVPTLEPGRAYLFETVIRTLTLGHHFTQGTADSNEVWLDVTVRAGDRVIGRSGGIDPKRGNEVDPWSHFVNAFVLDEDGRRIDRRNAHDIVTPLYNHQMPPGAGQTVHYRLELPEDVREPVTVEVRLRYRKFDQRYVDIFSRALSRLDRPPRGFEEAEFVRNDLPIVTLATDRVTFPVAVDGAVAGAETVENADRDIPAWQRWNDYGIGLLLKGKGELRQAEEAFRAVEAENVYHGPLNLARVHEREGRLDDAVAALGRAEAFRDEDGFPWWTWSWLNGVVNAQQGRLTEAESNLRTVLETRTPELVERGFDFSRDYVVINELGSVLFELGKTRSRRKRDDEATAFWREAVTWYERTLEIDSENVAAHYNLQLLHQRLGNDELAEKHRTLHQRYKPDDTISGRAVRLARERYPAANHAAEAVVIYELQRDGAPAPTGEETDDDGE